MDAYIVINNNDYGAGSLRAAIEIANTNIGQDTIILQSDVELKSAIKITDSVSISSISGSTIFQNGKDRIFEINDEKDDSVSTVTLHNLKLTGGNSKLAGGAIHSYENLNLINTELFGNTTATSGAAIYVENSEFVGEKVYIYNNHVNSKLDKAAGGGIYILDGRLHLTKSRIENNSATLGGGIALINSQGIINNSQINLDFGNGIYISTNTFLSIDNSTIESKNPDTSGGYFVEKKSQLSITNQKSKQAN